MKMRPDETLPEGHRADAPRGPALAGIAIWFGLLTAAAEVTFLLMKRHLRGQMLDVGSDFIWLLASAEIFIFAIIALACASALRIMRRCVSARLLVGVLGFVSAFSVLLHYRPLDMYARLVLAAGLATFAAGLARRHWASAHRLVRYSTPALALALVLASVWQVRSSRSGVPLASDSPGARGMPHVLVLILDTVAARDLSLYGYHRETTPNLDALASRGTVFTRAFSTAPWTVPSHASMFTGGYPFELSADWLTPLDSAPRTLAEAFTARGYATGLFGANRFLDREYGLDRGFAHVSVIPATAAEAVRVTALGKWLNTRGNWVRKALNYYRPLSRRSAADINADFQEWRTQRGNRPFMAVLNYIDAHAPYVAPEPFDTVFETAAPRTNAMMTDEWTPAAIEAERAVYNEAIAYVDAQVGELLRALQAEGDLDNTVVVITADHGEQFGEHGHMEHSPSLYIPSLWVPLLVIAPREVPQSRRVDTPVTLRDLPATIIDLVNMPDERFPGSSLARFWNDDAATSENIAAQVSRGVRTPPAYPISRGDMVTLIRDRYQYIVNGDGVEELYDFETDPLEQRDLAGVPAYAALMQDFRATVPRFAKTRRPAPPAVASR